MRSRVAILLAFANDWVDDKRHLRNLLDESKAIHGALAPLVEGGALAVPPAIQNATLDEVINAFRGPAYRDLICIFHFGGHASGSMLLFEDAAGQPAEVHASGLASYLGQQRGLVLVFLNGCSTEPQVRRLREAGVKAVVATTCAIRDAVAAEFAKAFYAELASRSLRAAFDAAAHVVKARWNDAPRSIMRDVIAGDEAQALPWPWIFDCDPRYESWTLARVLVRHRWRTRLMLATTTTLLFLLASFVISAGAARTVCRAPGVRTLCAVVRVGNIPTEAEQALWDEAVRQRSGDGLRAYLRRYPEGVHASEAKARLDGCRHERVETLGSEDEVRFPLVVNATLAHPFASQADARSDALMRGNEEAASSCGPLSNGADILSTRAEPHRWDCMEREQRFACGFVGESVCRILRRIPTDREDCFADR